MTEVFVTKLGTAKRIERSRIWIEGKRLVNAGFSVGQCYSLDTSNPKRWTLTAVIGASFNLDDPSVRAVSGKGDKPIIDITGAHVRDAFGAGTHVRVTYAPGLITITREG
jgi:hypothetical protein